MAKKDKKGKKAKGEETVLVDNSAASEAQEEATTGEETAPAKRGRRASMPSDPEGKIKAVAEKANNTILPNWKAFSDFVEENTGTKIKPAHVGIVLTGYKAYQTSPAAKASRDEAAKVAAEAKAERDKANAAKDAEKKAASKEKSDGAKGKKETPSAKKTAAAASAKPEATTGKAGKKSKDKAAAAF
jgi:hypothetical protein